MAETIAIAISVCSKVVEYTVKPILSPVVSPFKYLWEYSRNLENLTIKLRELELKTEEVRRFTNYGVEPPAAVKNWLDKVNGTSNEYARVTARRNLISNQAGGVTGQQNVQHQSINFCQRFSCSNLKQCNLHRKNVAVVLEGIVQLIRDAAESETMWRYESNVENLKKDMEDLMIIRDLRQNSIKDGEEPLPDAKVWLDGVEDICKEISGIIGFRQQTQQCCERLTCSECLQRRGKVDRVLGAASGLLREGRGFNEFSTATAETIYKRSLDNLKKKVEELEFEKQCEHLSLRGGEPSVQLWHNKVRKNSDKVRQLDEKYSPERQTEADRLSQNAEALFEEAKGLKEAMELKKLLLIAEEPWSQSIKNLRPLDSRTSTQQKIIEKLQEPDVGIVGIYGLGGIGKTTLAKQVAIQAKHDKIIDVFVFVEVSQFLDVKKIQQEIGCKLGLSFQEKEHIPERARELHQKLKNAEKTLLILDNIWECLDFEVLGIPHKDDCKDLKLLLTGRDKDVLKDKRGSSSYSFSIEALEWEDTWSLFKSKANVHQDHSLAIEVARKCGGVPIAIVTIASALSNKEDHVWRNALRELKEPSVDSFDGIAGDIYQSIALSYNYLKTDKLKETFLLCSSMPNTNDASLEDLWRYGVGLGLFTSCGTLEEERDNVFSLLSTLKSSSLLVDVPDDIYVPSTEWVPPMHSAHIYVPYTERFAMHDVVLDVARSIAQKSESGSRISTSVIPTSSIRNDWLLNCTHITLYDVELSESLKFKCPQLKFLYLRPKTHHDRVRISNEFFVCMSSLEVLHLKYIDLRSISTPLGSNLMKLQMLCLEKCICEEISTEKLKNLEILSFRYCLMFKLPEKFFHLTKLRIIELADYSLRVDLKRFISSFKWLEALYIRYARVVWKDKKSNNGSTAASGDVLKYLTSLVIQVPNAEMLRGLLSPELKRYNIIIGAYDWKNFEANSTRFLKVERQTEVEWIMSKLKGIKELEVKEAPGMTDNLIVDQPDLEDLRVGNSHLFCIFQKVPQSCLTRLLLWNLKNLKTICDGPIGMESFGQLRTLMVEECHRLTHVFLLANDKSFQKLEEIEVSNCKKMKVIFATSEEAHEIKLSKLRILKLNQLPKFKSLSWNLNTRDYDIPTPIFHEKAVVTHLQRLDISDINIDMIWDNQSQKIKGRLQVETKESNYGSCEQKAFPRLEKLRIAPKHLMMMTWQGLDPGPLFQNFTTLYVQKSGYGSWTQKSGYGSWDVQWPFLLHSKKKSGYGDLINQLGLFLIFYDDNDVECMREEMFKLGLQHFETIHVRGVESFVSLVPPSASLQNLTSLEVYNCNSLEDIGAFSIVKNLVNLIHLEIRWCKRIVEVVRNDEDLSGSKIVFGNMKRLVLMGLRCLTSFCSLSFFLEFPSLEDLQVIDCPVMKIFCGGDIATPNLHKLRCGRGDSIELSEEVNVNRAIQQLQDKRQNKEIDASSKRTRGP